MKSREQLTQELDAALKACAQKDDALKDCSQFPLGESLHYKVCSALDDNTCGQHYHHDDEWKMVVEALKAIVEKHPTNVYYPKNWTIATAQQALAHAERLTGKETK